MLLPFVYRIFIIFTTSKLIIKTDPMLKFNFVIKSTLFLLFIIVSFTGNANSSHEEPWFTSKDMMIKHKTFIELFGGPLYSNISYSKSPFNKMEQKPIFLYDAGLSIRFQQGKWFSFSPRFTFICQGIAFENNMKYNLRSNYLSFSFPVELQFELNKKLNKSVTKFFFYASPFVATPVSVHIKTTDYSNWLTSDEIGVIDLGGEAGFGFRIPTFSLEGSSNITIRLSYMRGVNDTYTRFEKNIINQSQQEKLFLNGGERYNSAVKLTIGVEIPMKAKKYVSFTAGGNGKKNYKRVVVVDEK
jgi:hypothetical protein